MNVIGYCYSYCFSFIFIHDLKNVNDVLTPTIITINDNIQFL